MGMDQSALPVPVALPGPRGVIQLALGARNGCILDQVGPRLLLGEQAGTA